MEAKSVKEAIEKFNADHPGQKVKRVENHAGKPLAMPRAKDGVGDHTLRELTIRNILNKLEEEGLGEGYSIYPYKDEFIIVEGTGDNWQSSREFYVAEHKDAFRTVYNSIKTYLEQKSSEDW